MRRQFSPKKAKKNISFMSMDEQENNNQEYEWIKDMDKKFKENIQNKIALIETLSKKGEQQRCMSHSIPFSLYCTFCRKVICASCMYNYNTHKSHKVTPLQLATKEIRQDIEGVHSKVEIKLNVFKEIINDINNRTIETTQVFTKTTTALNRFYQSLQESLKLKQKEQVKVLMNKQKDALQQYRTFFRKISELQIYLSQKYQTYANTKVKNELLVPSKNILQIINLHISQNQFYQNQLDKHKFQLDLNKLKSLEEQIMFKVDIIDKNRINYNIRVIERKMNSPRSLSPYAIAKPKKTPLQIPKKFKDKVNNSVSVLASPRSLRRQSPR